MLECCWFAPGGAWRPWPPPVTSSKPPTRRKVTSGKAPASTRPARNAPTGSLTSAARSAGPTMRPEPATLGVGAMMGIQLFTEPDSLGALDL